MSNVTAERTDQPCVILDILSDPDIAERIRDDSDAALVFDVEREAWVVMRDGDTVLGAYGLRPLNRYTLEIHAHILPEHRDQYAVETGWAILRWIVDNQDYAKILAEIPACYPDVIAFTKKFGFKQEGVNRLSVQKDGKMIDQIWLGITRQEVLDELG